MPFYGYPTIGQIVFTEPEQTLRTGVPKNARICEVPPGTYDVVLVREPAPKGFEDSASLGLLRMYLRVHARGLVIDPATGEKTGASADAGVVPDLLHRMVFMPRYRYDADSGIVARIDRDDVIYLVPDSMRSRCHEVPDYGKVQVTIETESGPHGPVHYAKVHLAPKEHDLATMRPLAYVLEAFENENGECDYRWKDVTWETGADLAKLGYRDEDTAMAKAMLAKVEPYDPASYAELQLDAIARAQREEDKKLSVLRDAISTSYAAASGHAGSLNTPEELAEKRRCAGRKLLLAVEAAQEWHHMLAREQITVMKTLGLTASAHVAVPEIDAPAPGI